LDRHPNLIARKLRQSKIGCLALSVQSASFAVSGPTMTLLALSSLLPSPLAFGDIILLSNRRSGEKNGDSECRQYGDA
jgi:hypothetical protein